MKLCLSCQTGFQEMNWRCPSCLFMPEQRNGFPTLAPEVIEGHTDLDSDRFRFLADLEARSFWFRNRNKLIVWAIQKYFPQVESFLEVGCGTGFVLSAIAEQIRLPQIYGSELGIDGLKFAQTRVPTAQLFQMDALKMPFEGEFDVIGIFDVLEHIESDSKVLQEIYKSLKPGGGVIITVPQHMFLWSNQDERARHFRRYNRQELQDKLENAGFKPLVATSFVSLLLPVMLASRHLSKLRSNEVVAREMAPNPVLNAFLEWLLGWELALVKNGCSLPFGGSLLMLAVKPG